MALITCPECEKEISDKAEACPNCGYVLIKKDFPKIRKTQLSLKESNPIMGALYILCGIVAIIGGLFTIAMIIGIFAIFGGFALIGLGAGQISGMQKGLCPYCNNSVSVKANATTCKCNHCKKVSSKKGNTLETID